MNEEEEEEITPQEETPIEEEETPIEDPIIEESIDEEIQTRTQIKQDEKQEETLFYDDTELINKIVEKKLKEAGVSTTKDQLEVDAYLRTNPEFSKYRNVALKYMEHPAYSNIPASNIMAIVAHKDLLAIGAKKEREAQKVVKSTQNTGTTVRGVETTIDWSSMTDAEFQARKAKILNQPM